MRVYYQKNSYAFLDNAPLSYFLLKTAVVSMWLLLIAIIGLYLVYLFWINYTPYWKKLGVPYMEGWPVIGSSPKLIFGMKSFFDFTKEMYMEHINYR